MSDDNYTRVLKYLMANIWLPNASLSKARGKASLFHMKNAGLHKGRTESRDYTDAGLIDAAFQVGARRRCDECR